MATDQEFYDLIKNHLRDGRILFVHSPQAWDDCNLPVDLDWTPVSFSPANLEDVPDDQYGVYCFMLKPDFIGPPNAGYLLYVGKTEVNRRFRRRFQDYEYEQRTSIPGRAIARALRQWAGHIWFYYAPIAQINIIKTVEDALINSCIPPCNVKFNGRWGTAIRAWGGERY